MRRTPSVSLNDHQQEVVDSLVATGRYSSFGDVVREGIRLVEEREAHVLALKEAIQTGLESGASPRSPEDIRRAVKAELNL